MRRVVYTAIFGGYDLLRDPLYINRNWDYICFTDRPLKSKIWQVRKVDPPFEGAKRARYFKINCTKILSEYDISIWHDGNLRLKTNPDRLLSRYAPRPISIMQHQDRHCIYAESHACKELKKDKRSTIDKQMLKYKKEGYPANNGLVATGLIIRKHTPEVGELMNLWWNEVEAGSCRDQLSFNYCLNKIPLALNLIPFSILKTGFFKHPHELSKTSKPFAR